MKNYIAVLVWLVLVAKQVVSDLPVEVCVLVGCGHILASQNCAGELCDGGTVLTSCRSSLYSSLPELDDAPYRNTA